MTNLRIVWFGYNGCCGPFWAICSSVCFLVALALPWYLELRVIHDVSSTNIDTTVLDLLYDDPFQAFADVQHTPLHQETHANDISGFAKFYYSTFADSLASLTSPLIPYLVPEFDGVSADQVYTSSFRSTKVELRGWDDAICSIADQYADKNDIHKLVPKHACDHGTKYSWRAYCPETNDDTHSCISLKSVYSTTGFLSAAALIAAAISSILFISRACSAPKPGFSIPLIVSVASSIIIGAICVILFRVAHANSLYEAFSFSPTRCNYEPKSFEGPCNSFYGSLTQTKVVNALLSYSFTSVWMPLGWIVSILAIILGIVAFFFALQEGPHRSWENVHYSDLIEPIQPYGMTGFRFAPVNGPSATVNYDYDPHATSYSTNRGVYYPSSR